MALGLIRILPQSVLIFLSALIMNRLMQNLCRRPTIVFAVSIFKHLLV